MNTNTTPNLESTADMIDATTPATLPVFTTPQTCTAPMELVRVNARNGKNEDGSRREVLAADRMRCIVIPELTVDGVPSKFQSIILDALRRTAKAQLDSLWTAEPMLRTVQAAIWSVDSLLLFAARETESQRLTKQNCADWFDSSKLAARLMTKGDAKLLAQWKETICGMAAPTIATSEKQCNAIIATIGKDDSDSESLIGAQIINKLAKRIASLNVQELELEAE
jgi:hypothetical protein